MLYFLLWIAAGAASVGICLWQGAFENFTWLWLLPVSAVGAMVVLTLLAFAFLGICCATVRLNAPQKDSAFFRRLTHIYIDLVMRLFRVRVQAEGLELLPEEPFFLACNHLSDTDPALILHALRDKKLAFLSKKENYRKPIVAQIMHKLSCQSLNRENDREALLTILRCSALISEQGLNVAAFPEGHVSKDHKLHSFHHGVFKIAQKAKAATVVCVLQGSEKIFSNLLKFRGTTVKLRILQVIGPERWKGSTAVQISQQAYEAIAQALGRENVCAENT